MFHSFTKTEARQHRLRIGLCLMLALFSAACAGVSKQPDAGAPGTNEAPYPILLTASEERRAASLAAWSALTSEQGITNAPPPELHPVSALLQKMPALTSPPLYLPKVGASASMSEEETRESLRRFIFSARGLLGVEPAQLSLVERTDAADGTKKARYEQRPFRYPLRGGYGVLEISFATDRRIIQINNTCIPEVESIARSIQALRPRPAEEMPQRLAGRSFTYEDSSGVQRTDTVAAGELVMVRELVIYPLARTNAPTVLEFHLAWEIVLGSGASSRIIFVDAVTDEVIAAVPSMS